MPMAAGVKGGRGAGGPVRLRLRPTPVNGIGIEAGGGGIASCAALTAEVAEEVSGNGSDSRPDALRPVFIISRVGLVDAWLYASCCCCLYP